MNVLKRLQTPLKVLKRLVSSLNVFKRIWLSRNGLNLVKTLLGNFEIYNSSELKQVDGMSIKVRKHCTLYTFHNRMMMNCVNCVNCNSCLVFLFYWYICLKTETWNTTLYFVHLQSNFLCLFLKLLCSTRLACLMFLKIVKYFITFYCTYLVEKKKPENPFL